MNDAPSHISSDPAPVSLSGEVAQDQAEPESGSPKKTGPWRLLPVLVLAVGLGAAFTLDLHHYMGFESLSENRNAILEWKQNNYSLSIAVFIVAYGIATAISLPGAIWMTLAGGFMFGTVKGGFLVLVAATLGATVIFLAARYAFADYFHAKCGSAIHKFEAGFRENAFSYLLVLRLVPLFPFWLVNLVPAFLGVSTPVYVISTLLGIMPGTFVYASLGNGLGMIVDKGGMPDMAIIWSPQILLPLLGLSFLAMIPVLYRKFTKE